MALLARRAGGLKELSGRALARLLAPDFASRFARSLHDAEARALDAVQERVHRGSTARDPAREAVATRALIVGRIERLRRATFAHLSLDAGPPAGRP